MSARLQFCTDACQCGLIGFDMLEHIKQRNQVITAIGDAIEVRQPRRSDGPAQTFAGKLAGGIIHLKAVDGAEGAEHPEVMARAAAYFQNSGIFRRFDDAANHARKDSSACDVPPVRLIQRGHSVIDDSFHQPSIPTVSRTT